MEEITVDRRVARAGNGNDTDDDTAAADGLRGVAGKTGGVEDLLDDVDGAIAHPGADHVEDQNGGNAVQGGTLQGAAVGNGGHQHHNGAQQIQTGQDGLALQVHLHFLAGAAALFGQHMDQQEDGQVVHDGGNGGSLADGHVGDTQHLSHQEGAGCP